MRIGFIGLGQMGRRMATNLLKHDHELVVHDAAPDAIESFVAQARGSGRGGAVTVLDSPAAVARAADAALFTMLPSTAEVEQVYFGVQGVLSAAGDEGSLVAPLLIDCSSADPRTAQRIALHAFHVRVRRNPAIVKQMLAVGLMVDDRDRAPFVLDAPVSGGVPGASKGTLSFMVGGEEIVVQHAAPLLSCMGATVHHCGVHGTGQASKLCHNLALAVQVDAHIDHVECAEMAGVSEALALGQRMRLDPANLSHIFNLSSAQCWACTAYNPVPGVLPHTPASRDYANGFKVSHMVKDLEQEQAAAASRQLHAALPMGMQALALYQQLETQGLGETDFSSIYQGIYGGHPRGEQPLDIQRHPCSAP